MVSPQNSCDEFLTFQNVIVFEETFKEVSKF